jgi:acyl-CoA thioester hydrolase
MRENFNFSTEIRVRLPETDAFGIVFHGYFYTYFDVARMDYLRNLGIADSIHPTRGFMNTIVHASATFKSPARFDDLLLVYARIPRIGHTSFTFEFLVWHKRENRLVATGETVHVAIDGKTWRPIPVPEEFRRVIRGYERERLQEGK